jgi:putative aldouronate transport system permease protein
MVGTGKMLLWPVGITWDGYKNLISYRDLWVGYGNTVFYTVCGTVLNLLATLPCAYALSRRDFRPRNMVMIFFMFTMFFGGGMIPGYLNVLSLGLVNTRFFILIHGLISVSNLIVCRTFFSNTIPGRCRKPPCWTALRILACSPGSSCLCPSPSSPLCRCTTAWAAGTPTSPK